MKTLLLSVVLITSASQVFGQKLSDLVDLYKEEAEFTFGLNHRRTHIYNEFGTIYGAFFGLNFDRRLKNTFLFSSTIFPIGKASDLDASYKRTRLHFAGVTEEYTYFKRNRFRLSTYASLGYGISQYELLSPQGLVMEQGRVGIMPLELGLHAAYELIPWLELRVGAGWRFFLLGHDKGLSGYYAKVALGLKYTALKNALKTGTLF